MNRQFLFGAVVTAFAVVLTWAISDFRLFQLATVGTWAIAMLGLNLLTGYNGQISLGHGAFLAIGMYTIAITNRDLDLSYPLALLVAFGITFTLGAIIGLPALRLPGASLALITLALAVALPQAIKKFSGLTGGAQGINVSGDQQWEAPGWTGLSDDQFRYLTVVAIGALLFWIAWNLVRGRWGLAMMAIRDNPVSAASNGVHLPRTKVTTFALSAGFAGVAGGLQMMLTNYVSPESVTIIVSISILTGIVIGGLGTIAGAVIGGLFVVFLPNYAIEISDAAPGVVYGVIIILVMLLAPGGVMGLFRRLQGWIRRRRSGATSAPEPAPSGETDTQVSSGATVT
jgi:branched-chain amino acid transport system permease protein